MNFKHKTSKQPWSYTLTTFRDLWPEIHVDMFGAEVSVVSQSSAQTAASTATGLVAALLLVDVWTDVAMARGEHTTQEHVALWCIEYYKTQKQETKETCVLYMWSVILSIPQSFR